jgi:hypothetical protein
MSLKRKKKWCSISLKQHNSGQVDMGDLARAHQELQGDLDRQRSYYRLARDFMSFSDRIGVACEAKLIRDKLAGIEMAMSQIVQATILADHGDLTQDNGDNAKENE